MQMFLFFSYIFQFWHTFHITISFLKTIFRRTYRKPLTWTAKRLCATSLKLLPIQNRFTWSEQSCTIFESFDTAKQEIRDANSLVIGWKQTLQVLHAQWRLQGGGKENRSGIYDVGATLKYKGQGTEEINFPLHFRSCITLWHLQGYLSAVSTRSFFHQKKPVYSLPIKTIL